MKKQSARLAAILLAFLIAGTIQGQKGKTKIDEDIVGILVGGTLSNITNYDAKDRVGFQGGIYWEWRFSEKFSGMPNLQYSERGALGKGGLSDIRLAYLSWPLQLKYAVSDKFAVATGIAWDLLLASKGEGISKGDIRDDDWRIPVIFGYNISDKLALGISYNFGLADITPNDTEKRYNNWGGISLAYKIVSW